MPSTELEDRTAVKAEPYRALFAVSDAIASHRDLQALFHELAGRLARAVQFDALSLVLHDPTTELMRRHILEASDHISPPPFNLHLDDDPAGMVWQTQRPFVTAQVDDLS